jgi:hypothetical protein
MTYFMATAIVILILLVGAEMVVRHPQRGIAVEDLIARLRPVDAELFRNLTSRETSEFLTRRLHFLALVRARRLQARAALDYLLRMFQNAGILVRVGDAGRSSELAEAAAALADHAVRVRVMTAMSIAQWSMVYAVPVYVPESTRALKDYLELRLRLAGYSMSWQPALTSRLASSM